MKIECPELGVEPSTKIWDVDYSTLRKMSDELYPRLEDFLLLTKGKVFVSLDIKNHG